MEIQSPLHSGRPERRPVNRQDMFTSSFVAQLVKNPPAMEETGFDSWIRKTPGERNGNTLQYSCLGNPMDRGAWRATVREVTRVGRVLATKPPPPSSFLIKKSAGFSQRLHRKWFLA